MSPSGSGGRPGCQLHPNGLSQQVAIGRAMTDTNHMTTTQAAELTFWATYRLLGGRSFPRTYQANITVPITASVDQIRQAIAAKTGYPVKRIQYSVNP